MMISYRENPLIEYDGIKVAKEIDYINGYEDIGAFLNVLEVSIRRWKLVCSQDLRERNQRLRFIFIPGGKNAKRG